MGQVSSYPIRASTHKILIDEYYDQMYKAYRRTYIGPDGTKTYETMTEEQAQWVGESYLNKQIKSTLSARKFKPVCCNCGAPKKAVLCCYCKT